MRCGSKQNSVPPVGNAPRGVPAPAQSMPSCPAMVVFRSAKERTLFRGAKGDIGIAARHRSSRRRLWRRQWRSRNASHAFPTDNFVIFAVAIALLSIVIEFAPTQSPRRRSPLCQAAEHRLYPDRRPGLRRSVVPRQPDPQDAEPRPAARRRRALHRLPRQPDLLADALGPDDRPARVQERRHAHHLRARAADAQGDHHRPGAEVGRLHDRHLRQVAPRRRGRPTSRTSAASTRCSSTAAAASARPTPAAAATPPATPTSTRPSCTTASSRRPRATAPTSSSARPLHWIESVQGQEAVLLLHPHQRPARAAASPPRGIRETLRRQGEEPEHGQVLRHDRQHRRQRRPAARTSSRSGASSATRWSSS